MIPSQYVCFSLVFTYVVICFPLSLFECVCSVLGDYLSEDVGGFNCNLHR